MKRLPNPYVSAHKWTSIVGCGVDSAAKVAAVAGARILQVPGLPTHYHIDDAHAIAARSRRIAGDEQPTYDVESRRPVTTAV